eukprot:2413541-Amphidinium_carterae.1
MSDCSPKIVQNQRGTGMSPTDMLDMLKDYVGLVLSIEQLEKVFKLEHDADVLTVADELEHLVRTRTGRALTGSLWKQCVEAQLRVILDKKRKEMLTKPKLDSATLTELKRTTLAEVEQIPELNVLPDRRNFQLQYMGVLIEVQIRCLSEHIELFLECVARTVAQQQGKLTNLPAQGVSTPIAFAGDIVKDFVAGALRTRRWLPELIADEPEKRCGERILVRGH